MYCNHCGKQMDESARFCSACGTAFSTRQPQSGHRRQLSRPRHPRMIAGVCAAFALEYGWDLAVVRILAAVLIVSTGVGLLFYLAAWIIIPDAPYALPAGVPGMSV
jgi:phage shock protein C